MPEVDDEPVPSPNAKTNVHIACARIGRVSIFIRIEGKTDGRHRPIMPAASVKHGERARALPETIKPPSIQHDR